METRALPFVFLHIPKTAGTSLLAVLGNVFGEGNVRRLGPGEVHWQSVEALLASPELHRASCLTGHFPAHAFGARLGDFRVFTILRHPVDRVMSLYRFLRRQPAAELARIDLRPGFGFAEFLACEAPELTGQVCNGMCDQLCNAPNQRDRTYSAFWQQTPLDEIVGRALTTLESLNFGLTEAMPETLRLLRVTLGLPFDPPEMVENASGPAGDEWSAANILRLVERNSGDLALYHAAAALFRTRMAALPEDLVGAGDWTRLEAGVEAPIERIAGRQGFHPYEPAGTFSWVIGAGPARLAFAAVPGRGRLQLKLYHVNAAYPVDELAVEVNGSGLAAHWHSLGGQWGVLETEPFPVAARNVLSLTAPYAIPVRMLAPGSADPRHLSVAMGALRLLAD